MAKAVGGAVKSVTDGVGNVAKSVIKPVENTIKKAVDIHTDLAKVGIGAVTNRLFGPQGQVITLDPGSSSDENASAFRGMGFNTPQAPVVVPAAPSGPGMDMNVLLIIGGVLVVVMLVVFGRRR